MNEYGPNSYSPMFHHIYIEKKAYDYPLTQKLLHQDYFQSKPAIEIDHYKDVFNRSNQRFHEQKQAPSLILAVKEGSFVYPGAPVCQSFGNEHFYYTSCIMNCIYDCEYCYLQGMYPSANLVVFVNLDDIFAEVHTLLQKHPVYLCISYDTDLLALEPMLGVVHAWMDFVEREPKLTVELRTKSANLASILDQKPNERFLLAWTISPESIVQTYEHQAPSFQARLKNIHTAMELGYPVRLCFDPMLSVPDWKEQYQELVETLAKAIDFTKLTDISLGVFRISSDYMSTMRKQRPDSAIIQYPYENDHGVCHIETAKSKKMIRWMSELLSHHISNEKIFLWEET